ncbi:MAG: FkbM family methyltransferase [Actinomycetota bacterium]
MPEGRELEIRLPGDRGTITVEVPLGDDGVARIIENSGTYEEHLLEFLRNWTRPDSICLDVGANIGAVSAALARFADRGVVVAVEPVPSNLAFLRRNLAAVPCADVRIIERTLGRTGGTESIQFDDAHPGGAFVATTAARSAASLDVSRTTIDTLVEDETLPRLDVVKIDAEGSEVDVLAGGVDVLRRHRPVLVLESNPIALRRFRDAVPADILAALRSIYGPVGYLDPEGRVQPVHSAAHLDALSEQHGLLDLTAGVPIPRDLVRALRWRCAPDLAGRLLGLVRRRPARSQGFVTSFEGGVSIAGRRTSSDGSLEVDLLIDNRSNTPFEVEREPHAIRIGVRTAAGPELRFPLPARIDEGTSATATIAGPADTLTGSVLSLVQEGWCWFDDLSPRWRCELADDGR